MTLEQHDPEPLNIHKLVDPVRIKFGRIAMTAVNRKRYSMYRGEDFDTQAVAALAAEEFYLCITKLLNEATPLINDEIEYLSGERR